MKKLAILIALLSCCLACTSDDDLTLNGTIQLDTGTYTLTEGSVNYTTSTITGLDVVDFMLTNGGNTPVMSVQVNRPADGQPLTGTYHFDRMQDAPDYVSATFSPANETYLVVHGTLDIQQHAEDKYTLTFHNNKGMSFSTDALLDFGGHITGTFVVFQ
ncbi:hypothetical protein HYN48_07340 [Flavobacterium magnum]|uniref:Lipocalin-like domain-containing protein n=1 Tax=Flavobacterium magnum TaxID=2162713 RepID=A0A2S0RD90_9FLAO|nr:hypothetical protein [Flavobacterium magnum]AWA29907.1 hypothetical protein HYN48_07340 [Flavobacterium magnum]